MSSTLPLVTPRLLLREFEEEDWRATHLYESDPEVVRYQSHGVRTPEESRDYILQVAELSRRLPRRVYDLAVVSRAENWLIGRCGMRYTDVPTREGTLWYILERASWGQGYITEAAQALMDFSFGTLGMHRMFADCDPRNPGSYRVMEKLGMRREAHFRENVFLKGEWCDSYVYAQLDHEWRARVRERG
ncbi:GNAT family N-acetyltransferase [Melittangium boletus]|uniref:GCN5-related N-acetyltransferase n=1 Tax=Melittangium boletus DSM 14713 TaxID=1294270 RepID=A0A250IIW4_9BACT|nr:GNAT family protein [Melittangium boletus]ATB31695.1 GCN5-related N-acetyltransferase [Melittangium boletus DSM 14713]